MWQARAKLNGVKGGVPHARVLNGTVDVARHQLGKVKTGAEVTALPADHHRAHALGHVHKDRVQLLNEGVGQRVALGRAVELQMQHRTGAGDAQQVQGGQQALDRLLCVTGAGRRIDSVHGSLKLRDSRGRTRIYFKF
jgi:hypothetical protein